MCGLLSVWFLSFGLMFSSFIHVLDLWSFGWFSNVQLYEWTTFRLSILPLMKVWIVPHSAYCE